MHVGIADHFGWAVLVTASPEHEVVDRRRVALVEEGVCEAPLHYESARLDVAATAVLVAEVRASVRKATGRALDELAAGLPGRVTGVSLRAWPPDFPHEIEIQRRAPYESRADAIMYRQELADAAQRRGWAVHLYDARAVVGQAERLLGPRATDVLTGPRAVLGPPWTRDHRTALAAAILAGSA